MFLRDLLRNSKLYNTIILLTYCPTGSVSECPIPGNGGCSTHILGTLMLIRALSIPLNPMGLIRNLLTTQNIHILNTVWLHLKALLYVDLML